MCNVLKKDPQNPPIKYYSLIHVYRYKNLYIHVFILSLYGVIKTTVFMVYEPYWEWIIN